MKPNHEARSTNYKSRLRNRFTLTFSLFALLLAACQPAATPSPDLAMTAAIETAFAEINIPTETPAPTETPVPTATVPRTPPALPSTFQTSVLKPNDIPRTYVTDSCEYLKNKWDPNKATPGTVVMVIMSHRINQDATTSDYGNLTIASRDLKRMMNDLHDAGFTAINMQQMTDFMYDNAKIPPFSVLIIVDDRASASKYNDHFRTYYEDWGWPVVNAYIGLDERPDLWAENAALSAEGWVDYQAHGYIHNIPTETPAQTETPVPTATIPRTPPALPSMFQTSILKSHDIPRTYMTDSCQYLKNKWDPNKADRKSVV